MAEFDLAKWWPIAGLCAVMLTLSFALIALTIEWAIRNSRDTEARSAVRGRRRRPSIR